MVLIIKKLVVILPLFILASAVGCANKDKVTVTLNFNNANPNQTITIDKGSTLNVEDPIKDRCVFLWWKLGEKKFNLLTPIQENITLNAHYHYDGEEIFKKRDNSESKHDTANLRVMSFNLLTSIYNNHPHHHGYNPINDPYPDRTDDGRDYQARDAIMHYLPDVVGLQECDQTSDEPKIDAGWYDFFKAQNEAGNFPYKIINDANRSRDVGGGKIKTIFSTLMYNSDTVEPESDTYETTLSKFSDNNNCRWLTCCVFHLKNDKTRRFIVTSTHWDLQSTGEEKRHKQAIESAELTLNYASKHDNLPVITTGDYNQTENSEEYKLFIANSGYSEGKYIATKRGLVTPTYHLGDGTGNSSDKTESSKNHWWYRNESTMLMRQHRADRIDTIDHLFISPNIKCCYYEVVSETSALYASDHMPSYVDVII